MVGWQGWVWVRGTAATPFPPVTAAAAVKGFTTFVTQRLQNNNSNNGFTKKICHKTSTLAKIATSPFELHYSYSVRLVNMRVSWIMNMPTCDARARIQYTYTYNTYTIYVYIHRIICIQYTSPGSGRWGSSSARLAAQHWLLGHSLLDLIWDSICRTVSCMHCIEY